MKGCKKYIRTYRATRLRCGLTKRIGDETVREYCEVCQAYNEGYKKGFAKKVKKSTVCQGITCAKSATHIICIDNHLIRVCRAHTKGGDAKKIPEYNEQ